ncbi:hypothetical protein OG393_30190 [Streptomyces sp. NBC_01216]|uniref:hypothetical protein n=1 Tax=Streptomyces sp. NBC_01216 TaxID=2903778 RepID=UPI002E1096E1|nr:hypothetical protein OG393_30190 [Streptomyces sp. NBC_01216]
MNDPRVPYDPDETVRHSGPGAAPVPVPVPAPGGPEPGPGSPADEYSATVLGSHWFERPVDETVPDRDADAAPGGPGGEVVPDRVEGEVLRFGPGVTAAALGSGGAPSLTTRMIWHGTLPGADPGTAPPPPRRPGVLRVLRRYALALVVLLAVLGYLGWQRFGPPLSLRETAVTAPREPLACDATADVVGVVRTNGRPGTITYRWDRSDGSTSGLLRERVARGQREATLHLLWTFHGRGTHQAAATLVITSPAGATATGRFVYRCA